MADVIIRQAGPADTADIFEIEKLCFPDPWSMDSIRYELEENEKAFYLVAEHSGKVVGYMGLWWILDEGHITNVAVRPGYRNRKIAEGIIRVMLEHTIGAGILHHTLEVRRDNQPAINLYEKFGFEVDGIRKGYYQFDGEDALIMWRHATEEEIAELAPEPLETETKEAEEEAAETAEKTAADTEETAEATAEEDAEEAIETAEKTDKQQPKKPLRKQRPKRHRSKK